MSDPLVSVVIPCFGQARYLPEAVASVVAQTFKDWEVVIVDDGSPDDTAEVAERLIAAHGDRFRLIRQRNRGVVGARNAGIAATNGRYILPLDADDVIHPEMLAETVALLESDPRIGVAYSDYRRFEGSDAVIKVPEFDLDQLCRVNYVTCCALFRRTAWAAVGGYNPNMAWGFEDWDFWLACAEHGFAARGIPRVLFSYRDRPGTMIEQALAREDEMVRQVRANHPRLFTRRQRVRRRLRHLPTEHPRLARLLLIRQGGS